MSEAVRLIVPPETTGLLLPAVGAAGRGFTVNVVVAGSVEQPPTVATTV